MVLAATPLALWIAWSPALLAATLAVAVLGAGLLVLLTEKTERSGEDRACLPEAFLQEMQQLHPMVYHHSGRRSSRFRRTMRRLSRIMKGTERGAAPR